MHIIWNSNFPWIHFEWNDVSTPPTEETKVVSTPIPPKITPKPANVPTTTVPSVPVVIPPPVVITTPTPNPTPPVVPPPVTPTPTPIPPPPTPVIPTNTKLDMLTVMGSNIPGYCMSGTYDILLTAPTLQLHVKNPIGFPVDIRFYDEHGVYDQQTEVNWTDPYFVKLHVANGGRGMKMCDRYVSSFPHTQINTESPILYIKNGQYDFYPESVGESRYVWQKPYYKDWGGDVKNALTYQLDYYWSDPKNREQYFFVPPFGLVKWNHGNLQADGTYKLDNDPPASIVKQSLASWQKTLAKSLPDMKAFSYNVPFVSAVKLPRGTY